MKRWATLLLLLLILLLALEISFSRVSEVYSTGRNALWVRHAWVNEERTEEEYKALTSLLVEMRITEAYFHSGPFLANGTVDPARITHVSELLNSITL